MSPMPKNLLVLNAGSSSLKFALFRTDTLDRIESGKIDRSGATDAKYTDEIRKIIADLALAGHEIEAVAHRIVHGGLTYARPVLVSEKVKSDLRDLIPFAPLHQPQALRIIDELEKILPSTPQYADFDTAFHSGQDALHTSYALPLAWREKGIRKYGFHGLSYQYICGILKETRPDLFQGKTVIAHLGSGSSVCAVQNGQSIDTSMGMTALDGVTMATRPGNIDPGIILYLEKKMGLSPDEIEDQLYHNAGLLGLSGISGDVRTLEKSDDPRARFALDFYALSVAKYVANMAVSLGGVNALVFTGGIGENALGIRNAIHHHLDFLPAFEVLVIPTNEEKRIAENIKNILLA